MIEQTQLTDGDLAVLDFESRWPRHTAAKEAKIREVFGLSVARYYQRLNTVIDSPAAVRHDPLLVGRLQRTRDARAQARATRVFGTRSPADYDGHARTSESIEPHGEISERPV
jgi:hypothetical protein